MAVHADYVLTYQIKSKTQTGRHTERQRDRDSYSHTYTHLVRKERDKPKVITFNYDFITYNSSSLLAYFHHMVSYGQSTT